MEKLTWLQIVRDFDCVAVSSWASCDGLVDKSLRGKGGADDVEKAAGLQERYHRKAPECKVHKGKEGMGNSVRLFFMKMRRVSKFKYK